MTETRTYKIVDSDIGEGKILKITTTTVSISHISLEELEEQKLKNIANNELIDEQLAYFKE